MTLGLFAVLGADLMAFTPLDGQEGHGGVIQVCIEGVDLISGDTCEKESSL